MFYTIRKGYGPIEVRFANEEGAVACTTMTLKAEEWALLPTYLG